MQARSFLTPLGSNVQRFYRINGCFWSTKCSCMLWPFRLHLLLHRRHLEPWWKALWSRKKLHFWTSEVMVMEISALQALKLAENFLSVLFLWNSCSTLQTLRKAEDWQPLRRHFRWISLSSRGELDKSTSHWVVWYSHALPMRTRTGLPLVCLRQGLGQF